MKMNSIASIDPRIRYMYCWSTSTCPVTFLKKFRRKIWLTASDTDMAVSRKATETHQRPGLR